MLYLDSKTLERELGINNGGDVHRVFTQSCFNHMTKYTPGGTSSHLNQQIEIATDEIAYNSVDAHYLYTGLVMVDPETGSAWARKGQTKVYNGNNLQYHTPNTGAYWDQKMWNAEGDKVVEEVQRYIDRS